MIPCLCCCPNPDGEEDGGQDAMRREDDGTGGERWYPGIIYNLMMIFYHNISMERVGLRKTTTAAVDSRK